MKLGYQISIGLIILSFIISMFVFLGLYVAHTKYINSITIVAEGVVDGMYIDVSDQLFNSSMRYFLSINEKIVEVTKSAYNKVQIGDIVRVFANKGVAIL